MNRSKLRNKFNEERDIENWSEYNPPMQPFFHYSRAEQKASF